MISIINTSFKDVKIISPNIHVDSRGYFFESYNHLQFKEKIGDINFIQDNESKSNQIGVLRGLHYQISPYQQGKLVRCSRGAIFDAAVDIRKDSPTYGQWKGYEMTEENGHQLYVPVGFAHGFVTLEQNSEIVYKCSDYYAPETEGSVLWSDPDVGIDWPLTGEPILSEKDQRAPLLKDFDSPFVFGVNS